MERFVGKIAVVTGAGGGIASAITRELLKWNVHVVGIDINMCQLQAFQDELLKNTELYVGKFYPITCDITKDEEVQKAFEWISDHLKSVSILINGAGIFSALDEDIEKVSSEVIDQVFGVNTKGTILCAKKAMNLMIQNSEQGHIINICSIAGCENFHHRGFTIYSASKHAIRVFSDGLRREITKKRANIKVTTLFPGIVDTPLISHIIPYDKEKKEEILQPDDIARGCISILNTPHHVLFSECTIESIYRVV